MFSPFSRILVVDDSAVTRKIYCRMLEKLGFNNVDEACNGEVALAMLLARHYKLVISDWQMSPMNGLELLAAMKKSNALAQVPFIITTAHAVKFAQVARDGGSIHYLIKPFTQRALLEKLRLATFQPATVP